MPFLLNRLSLKSLSAKRDKCSDLQNSNYRNGHSGCSRGWDDERQNPCHLTPTSTLDSPDTQISLRNSGAAGPDSLQSLISKQDSTVSDAEISEDDLDTNLSGSEFEAQGSSGRQPRTHTPLVETLCPFGPTAVRKVLWNSHAQSVPVTIHAKFARQYLEDRAGPQPYHIMYRRNYFAVSINYSLSPATRPATGYLYLNEQGLHQQIKALGVRTRAVNSKEHGENVPISVFTAKRGPPMNPAPPLERELQPNMQRGINIYPDSTGHGDDVRHRPIHHTFQRLQFRKATENNGVRRRGQSFYHIVVELRALVIGRTGGDEWVKVASTISGPILVRGRCPNSFEPYDPKNLKRRPQKNQQARPERAAARPPGVTKHRGPSKKQGRTSVTAKTNTKQQKGRRSSTETYDSTPTLTSGSHTRAKNSVTSLKESDSPLMTPWYKIPPEKRLPLPNEISQLPTFVHDPPEQSLKIQSPDPFAKYEDEDYQPTPYGEQYVRGIDVWRPQHSHGGIDFKIPSYDLQHDEAGGDWQLTGRYS